MNKGCDDMAHVVENIISCMTTEQRKFLAIQKKDTEKLKKIRERQLRGENVEDDIARLKKHLQAAGIIDDNGNLVYPYAENE
jgi:hypothetical protein